MFEKKWEVESFGPGLFDVLEEGQIFATISGKDRAVLMTNAPALLAWLQWIRDNLITQADDNYPDDVTIGGLTLDEVIATAGKSND